jgi:hypothetical protein
MKTPHEFATIRVQGPGMPLWAAVAIAVAVVLGALWWRQSIRSERDAWWRAEIAKQSRAVETIITAGNREAEITDADILKGLGDQDAKLKDAERKLAEASKPKPVVVRTELVREPEPDCPRIPAHCVAD